MANVKERSRLDAIVDGASKLPLENQELILATIRGMLFTREHLKRAQQTESGPGGNTKP